MNALHLLWIIPLSAGIGFAVAAMLSAAKEKTEAEHWHDAFETAVRLYNTQCEITQEYAQPMTMARGLKEYCKEQGHCSQCDFGGSGSCILAETVPCQWEIDE